MTLLFLSNAIPVRAQTVPDAGASRDYNVALGFLKKKLYPQAAARWTKFIQTYPKHERLAFANYYLGVCQFHQKQLPQAAATFRIVLTKYPKFKNADGAQFNLALLYGNGLGRTLDRETARRWFQAAAEQGNVQAQYNLARMLQSGDGVQADVAAARGWYEKAARQDFAPAQNNLALMYLEGQGMPRDRARAVRWVSRAAAARAQRRVVAGGVGRHACRAQLLQ